MCGGPPARAVPTATLLGDLGVRYFLVLGMLMAPGVSAGFAVCGAFWGGAGEPGIWTGETALGWVWSGRGGQCPQPGEDFGEQAVAGREPQDQAASVADDPAGDADQPVAAGGDHGFAAAHAVTSEDGFADGGGGELVQPGGHAGGEQRAPHPCGVDRGVARRQMAEGGAVLAVAEDVLDGGAVPVPVLYGGGLIRGGYVQARQDEAVAVDGAGPGELGMGRARSWGVQGAAAPGAGVGRDLAGVQPDAADQQRGVRRPPVRPVIGHGDLGAVHLDGIAPVLLGDAVQQPPQRGDPLSPDGEGDALVVGGAGEVLQPLLAMPVSRSVCAAGRVSSIRTPGGAPSAVRPSR